MYVFAEVGSLTDDNGSFLRLSLLAPQLKLPAYYDTASIGLNYFMRYAKSLFKILQCEGRSPIESLSDIVT